MINIKNDFLYIIFIVIISFIGIIIVSLGLSALVEYTNYRTYYKDGYEVQYNTENILSPTCEIKVVNQNDSETWEKCSFIGDNYIIKNFAKKQKTK